jgi:hypothetical protein
MKKLKTQKQIAKNINKVVTQYRPDVNNTDGFFGMAFAAKAYSHQSGAGWGIKNSKKDVDALSDFIHQLNKLERSYENLSQRAKKQISFAAVSKSNETPPNLLNFVHLYRELSELSKVNYKDDWVIDRSDPAPLSVCRAVYWLAAKLGVTIMAGKAPVGTPFGDFGQDCFDASIVGSANFEHYSKQYIEKIIEQN